MTAEQILLIPHKRMLTPKEAALWMGSGVEFVYKLIQAKEVAHTCPGGKTKYVYREDLDSYMNRGKVEAKKETEKKARK
jgi:excisionase family DNA binding protein